MENRMKKYVNLPASGPAFALLLAATMTLSAAAQTDSGAQNTTSTQSAGQTSTAQTAQSTPASSGSATTSATGQPLSTKSNEGFWGHLNPLARKKWVNRQVSPVKDRLNELDQLSSKNSGDIKDLDTRSQAGIHHAQDTADAATQQANTANTQAGQAQQLAQSASSKTAQLNQTVTNLDQYSPVADTEIRFRPGQTVLNAKAKEALDQVAQQLDGKKGYIVEVEGYSRSRGQAGIANSQRMADAVVRYLVVDHKIPVYRIHQVAMGNAPVAGTNDGTGGNESTASTRGSLVHVKLMQNSLAAVNGSATADGSAIGGTQGANAQGASSQPMTQKP